MAGAGYKLFNTGDVLTAQQVNEYLMQQTIMVFADAAARTTALSGVLAEGMLSYLKSTDSTEVYNGSAWVALAADQTPLTTKGDLFTFTTTDARLASSGVNGDILTVDTSTASGLKWAAPTSATVSYTLLNSGGTSLSGASTSVSVSSYDNYIIRVNASSATAVAEMQLTLNNDTASNYIAYGAVGTNTALTVVTGNIATTKVIYGVLGSATHTKELVMYIGGGKGSGIKPYWYWAGNSLGGSDTAYYAAGFYSGTSAITSIQIKCSTGTLDAGTVYIYGA